MTDYTHKQGLRAALVTGAASGIGKGIAERLVADGFQVTIADINVDGAREIAAAFNEAQGASVAHAVRIDVTDEASVASAISQTIANWGRLDVLCANAGIYPGAPIEDISVTDWDRVLDLNLRGSFLCLKHALPQMRTQGYGRVVLTSSVTGAVTGFPGWTHYGASKAGLLGMMRSAALEVVKDGITVNAVMPGNVRTPAWADLPEEYLQTTESAIPIGRLAEPSDIANGVAFFADERSSYVTGQTLVIDGGQVLPEVPMN